MMLHIIFCVKAVMEWSFGENVVIKNGQLAVHRSAIQDEFKRNIFTPSEMVSLLYLFVYMMKQHNFSA